MPARLCLSRQVVMAGLTICMAGFLGACQTTSPSSSSSSSSSLSSAAPQTNAAIQNDKITQITLNTPEDIDSADQELLSQCPIVQMVDDLSELHQFRQNGASNTAIGINASANYNDDEKIAWIALKDFTQGCTIVDGKLAVNIDLEFQANLGPRSRIFKQDQPSVSYPFFIALTDASGHIIDKDIHGVSLSFSSDQTSQVYREKLQKLIDFNDLNNPPHLIMVGFQLSPDELTYNQIHRGKLLAPQAGKKPSHS